MIADALTSAHPHPRAASPLTGRLAAAVLVGLAHVGVLVAATHYTPTPDPVDTPPQPLMVALVAPPPAPKPVVAEAPKPKPTPPKPVEAKPPKPKPRPVAAPRAEPVVEPEPTPAPREPVVAQPSPAPAAPTPPAEAKPAPVTVTAPSFEAAYLNNPPPQYPSLARNRGQEGEVVLKVLVSPRGEPVKVELDGSSGHRLLDEAAAEAVRHWRFIPAKRGNEAVEDWVRVPVNFKLQS